MKSRQFLQRLIGMSPFTLSPGIGKSNGKYKEATVACILRVAMPTTSKEESQYFESPHDALEHTNDDNLEILFIKRAERERDRWSGHVAFPGYRVI